MKEYALYKGDNLISTGTVFQIAQETNTKYETLMFYKTPTYMRRLEKRSFSRNAKVLVELDH